MADEDRAIRIAREVVLSTFAGEARGLTWAFRRISALMQDVYLDDGEVVFTEGAAATDLYFVVDGAVKLSASSGREVTFGPKSAIGAFDAVLERPLSSTAIVVRKAHLLRLRNDDWFDVLEDSFNLAQLIITNFASNARALRQRPPPLGGFDQTPPNSAVGEWPRQFHLVDRVLLLRGVPIFAHAGVQALASLAELATEIQVAKDQVLAPRGDPNRPMVVVVSGEISAAREAPVNSGRFGRGALVCGAMAVGDTSDYEFRAPVKTRALAISRDDYLDVMEEQFGLVRSTLYALVEEQDQLARRRAAVR